MEDEQRQYSSKRKAPVGAVSHREKETRKRDSDQATTAHPPSYSPMIGKGGAGWLGIGRAGLRCWDLGPQ